MSLFGKVRSLFGGSSTPAPKKELSEQEKFWEAFRLFARDRVSDAYPLFWELAEKGFPRALYFMGKYYCRGWGIPIDKNLGLQYFQQGAEKGDVLCQLCLAYEEGLREDIVQAMLPTMYFMARAGDSAAQTELGIVLRCLDHIDDASLCHLDTKKEAENWLQTAAEAGYWSAIFSLADFYENVFGDSAKSVQWYEVLTQMRGNHAPNVVRMLCDFYLRQPTDNKELAQKTVRMITKWANEGYDWPMFHLAGFYEYGLADFQEDEKRAIGLYEKAYACHGEVAGEAAHCLGSLYRHQGDKTRATEWYVKSYGCHGETAGEAALDLARLYEHEGNKAEAIEWYEKAYECHGDAAEISAQHLASLYKEQGNKAQAMEWYEKTYECHGDTAELAAFRLAELYEEQGNELKGIEWCQKVYEYHGEYAGGAASELTFLYQRQGNETKVIEWYQKVCECGEKYAGDAAWGLACLYEEQGDDAKAIEWYRKAYECPEEDVEEGAALGLAQLYERQGNETQAMEWYEKAYEYHDAGAGVAGLGLGRLYEGQGNEAQAMEWYEKAYGYQGYDLGAAEAALRLARLYERQGNVTLAVEWYQKAIDCHEDNEEEAKERVKALLEASAEK